MANSETFSKNGGEITYNELVSHDELTTDYHPLYEKSNNMQRVSMFTVRDEPRTQRYKWAAIALGLLSATLLAVITGLSVHLNLMSDKQNSQSLNSTQVHSELAQLQADYNTVVMAKYGMQVKMEESKRTINSLQSQINTQTSQNNDLQQEKTKLQSVIAKLEQGCGHCPSGWEMLDNTCYFFAISNRLQSKSWNDAQIDCTDREAELAIVDTLEKQRFITRTIKSFQFSSMHLHQKGFWIGLKDDLTEGIWKWINGKELTEGYWMEGEPNDEYGTEDCAAAYPNWNLESSWNDAPCYHPLKWICEMEIQKNP